MNVGDKEIIELFFARNEQAIEETQKKYGAYCLKIAQNILDNREDAEECLSDALHSLWNRIPPVRPDSLKAFLGKIIRDAALSRYRAEHAQKRFAGFDAMLDELDECVPSHFDVFKTAEIHALTDAVNAWVKSLSKEERVLFVKRYYFGESVKDLSEEFGYTANQTAQKMMKLRNKLRKHLEKEGITI